jgi:hypothetical protein
MKAAKIDGPYGCPENLSETLVPSAGYSRASQSAFEGYPVFRPPGSRLRGRPALAPERFHVEPRTGQRIWVIGAIFGRPMVIPSQVAVPQAANDRIKTQRGIPEKGTGIKGSQE